MNDNPWKTPVRSCMSTRKTLSTVRVTTAAEANRTACERSSIPATKSATPKAQPFESDRHGEADRYLQRDLGMARAVAVDVAVMDEVADFEKRQQHREHDGAGIDHARRCVVGAVA